MEESSPSATQKFESDNLNTSAVEDHSGRDLSTNVEQISKRLVPRKGYKSIQKVEEKVVQEKSIRTGSPRRRRQKKGRGLSFLNFRKNILKSDELGLFFNCFRATLLHFAPTNELPDVARVQLLLSNISERPLKFKLKSEPGIDISALPSAKGYINAHGSTKCTLTWRREANVEKWSDAKQPKMLLILDFLHDKMKNEKHTLTRLIGKPPIEQLMLDAVTNEYSRSISKESVVLEQAHIPRKELKRKKYETKMEGVVSSIANWLNQQSKESLFGLLLLVIFFYFLGTINSSKRKQHDE
uniref:MSP domain-containing protein n=1 Tax=Elaeophora elaphi TaxID=1147741 RepID=A0A0R3RFY9_9BILA